jgi:hypothetical protein
MRRAKPLLASLALLALSGAASACALYFEEPPPEPTEPPTAPPPVPSPWPEPDAGTEYPPPEPLPPRGVTAEILIPPSLQNEDLFLDLVWGLDDRPMDHDFYRVGPGTQNVYVGNPNAIMLAATLYTTDGQIVDAGLFRATCPEYTVTPLQTRILEVPLDYGTIQEAVNAASDGDMVYVHPGTYYEHIRLRPGVHLVGAGAHRTVLDGDGLGENLIDFTGAAGAVVRGFTLRNVGPRVDGCDSDRQALECSGNWFAAALYGDGHDPETQLGSCLSSIVLMHNVIEVSDIGVLLYFHAAAAIRNNLFVENGSGVVANYLNGRSLITGNTFDVTQHRILGAGVASGLDASNNIFANAPLGTETNVQPDNQLSCNVFFEVYDSGPLGPGEDGNVYLDPGFRDVPARDYRLRDDSEALLLGCYEGALDPGFVPAPGAYGGPLGDWYQRDVTVEELKRFIE